MPLKVRPARAPDHAQPTIRLTEFENRHGPLSKRVSPDGDGFRKTSTTNLWHGSFQVLSLPFAGDATRTLIELAKHLKGLGSKQAIGLCHYFEQEIKNGVIASEALAQPGEATRTKPNFPGESGAALLLLDGDGVRGLVGLLEGLWPGFAEVAALRRPSASAGVSNPRTGAEMPGGGEHVYVVISDGSKGREVLMALHRLAWMHDLGHFHLAADGNAHARSCVDTTVWVPSRLIYEGAVILDPPLVQLPREIVVRSGGVLDVDALLAFAAREAPKIRVYERIRRAANDPDFRARQQARKNAYIERDVAKRMANGASAAEARRAALLSIKSVGTIKGTLTGSTVFETKDGERITVGEILLHPAEHADKVGPDPHEGRDYGTTTAQIKGPGAEGKPCIFSYAHGEGIYRLVHDRASLDRALDEKAFASHADLIAAMVDADLDPADRNALHRRAEESFGVKFRASESSFKAAKESERQRRCDDAAQHEPRIILSYDPNHPAAMADLIEEAFAGMEPAVLLNYGGRWAAVIGEPVDERPDPWGILDAAGRDRLSILRLNNLQAAYYVDTHLAFLQRTADGKAKLVTVSDKIVGICVNLPPDRRKVPRLDALRSVPPISPTGEIRTAPGLQSGIYYDGSAGTLEVPDYPTLADARRAWAFVLRAIFREFPFASYRDTAVLLALLVTLMTRHELGTAPAFVISAPLPGTGKSLLAEIAILMTTGARAPMAGYENADTAEVRKLLTTLIASGAQAILFDNVEGDIGNAQLNRALTAEIWSDRILSTNTAFEGRINSTFVFTSNGAIVVGDSRRRSLRLNLLARNYEHPEQRPIRNRQLALTVIAKRPELIAALLTIIRAHRQAGMPGRCSLGSFDTWAERVGRLVEWLTGVDPTSTQAALAADDPKHQAMRAVYRGIERWFGPAPHSAAQMHWGWRCEPGEHPIKYLSPEVRDLHSSLRVLCGERLMKNPLAKMLASFVDRQIDGRIIKKEKDANNNTVYRIVAAKGAPPIAPANPPMDDEIRYANNPAY